MAETNPNARLEAFCDGVFAIALTLLIIEIKLPATDVLNDSGDVWKALGHIVPAIFAFVLSFVIILITWVNHHGMLKQINKSSAAFMYANGLLLLSVVFLPFPTALMGEHLLTNHAAPSVVLFNAVTVIQALGWVLLTTAAIRGGLARDEASLAVLRGGRRNGYGALAGYAFFAVLALWFPVAVAIIITLVWGLWLVFSLRMRHN